VDSTPDGLLTLTLALTLALTLTLTLGMWTLRRAYPTTTTPSLDCRRGSGQLTVS
jgi:hypothetical protein